ncbi:hypothetical protein [Propionivibrio sp.]|uniref:hypothetical protein n=1 Tax=Propionivibrio sp. TaxID=2212460 RepID=UPI003BF0B98C
MGDKSSASYGMLQANALRGTDAVGGGGSSSTTAPDVVNPMDAMRKLGEDRASAIKSGGGTSQQQMFQQAGLASKLAKQGISTDLSSLSSSTSDPRAKMALGNTQFKNSLDVLDNGNKSQRTRQDVGALGQAQAQEAQRLSQQILGFAEGGTIKETPEQLMARMAAKYGTGTPQPTVQVAQAPVPQPAQQPAPQNTGGIGGVIGLLRGRSAQIDKAAGYACGGKVKGHYANGGVPEAVITDPQLLSMQHTQSRPPTQPMSQRNPIAPALGNQSQPGMLARDALNNAGNVVDSLPYAAAQFVPVLNAPLGAAAGAVHAAQGRYEELPIDAASMMGGKGAGVLLQKGQQLQNVLAKQAVAGAIGRTANTVQAVGSADAAVKRQEYAKGGAIKPSAIVAPQPVAERMAPAQQLMQGIAPPTEGGMIQGPGTPTSDSIQAVVRETKEPIAVSTGERIVSKKQDKYLQRIAKGMGFESVDAMLEHGTGKPVGPTIKGGMKHANTGVKIPALDPEEVMKHAALTSGVDYVAPQQAAPVVEQAPQKFDVALSNQQWKEGSFDKPTLVMPPEVDMGAYTSQPGATFASSIGNPVKNFFADSASAAGGNNGSYEKIRAERAAQEAVAKPVAAVSPKVDPKQVAPSEAANTPSGYKQTNETFSTPTTIKQDIASLPVDTAFTADAVQPAMRPGQIQLGAPSGSIHGKSTVDATQMKAPDGGGYLTGANGKAIYLPPQAAPARDPNKQYDAYGNDMTRTNAMKAELAGMQRDRFKRDMGADITDPKVRAVAQQQLAMLDKENVANQFVTKSQQDSVTTGLEQQVKGQALAAGAIEMKQKQAMAGLQNDYLNGDTEEIRKLAGEKIIKLNGGNKQQAPVVLKQGSTKDMNGVETTNPEIAIDPVSGRVISAQSAQGAAPKIDYATFAKTIREHPYNKGKSIDEAKIKKDYDAYRGGK